MSELEEPSVILAPDLEKVAVIGKSRARRLSVVDEHAAVGVRVEEFDKLRQGRKRPPKPTEAQLAKSRAQRQTETESVVAQSLAAVRDTIKKEKRERHDKPAEDAFFARGEAMSKASENTRQRVQKQDNKAIDRLAAEEMRTKIHELLDADAEARVPRNSKKDAVIRHGFRGEDRYKSGQRKGRNLAKSETEWFEQGSQTKKEKPGFFQKVGGFFKKLFGNGPKEPNLSDLTVSIARSGSRPRPAIESLRTPASSVEANEAHGTVLMAHVIEAWNKSLGKDEKAWKLGIEAIDGRNPVLSTADEIKNRLGLRLLTKDQYRSARKRVEAFSRKFVQGAEIVSLNRTTSSESRKKAA